MIQDEYQLSNWPTVSLAHWPNLSQVGLPADQRALRQFSIGGSDANTICSGDARRILSLWHIKRGDQHDADLSSNLPVMLGCWTESFNRQWYERETGLSVHDTGAFFRCGTHAWRHATVDGIVDTKGAIWEAKHTSAFSKPEDVLSRYMPQLQHNMAVVGLGSAVLSVIYGNHRWEAYEVARDWLYQEELLEAEKRFWECVQTGEPPTTIAPPAPPRPVSSRELCFDGNNLWASAAADWLETTQAAKRHSAATITIKDMLEPDVTRAFGHGLEAKRSKSGAVTIRRWDA